MYDQQIEDNKGLVINLQEYKDWKVNQEYDHDFNEMLYFFTFLAKKQGIIDPTVVLSKQQIKAEIQKRTTEMSKCFNKVELLYEKYPYENHYDCDGQYKTEYFHASGKK